MCAPHLCLSAAVAWEERAVQWWLHAEGGHRHGLLLCLQALHPQNNQHRVCCEGQDTLSSTTHWIQYTHSVSLYTHTHSLPLVPTQHTPCSCPSRGVLDCVCVCVCFLGDWQDNDGPLRGDRDLAEIRPAPQYYHPQRRELNTGNHDDT